MNTIRHHFSFTLLPNKTAAAKTSAQIRIFFTQSEKKQTFFCKHMLVSTYVYIYENYSYVCILYEEANNCIALINVNTITVRCRTYIVNNNETHILLSAVYACARYWIESFSLFCSLSLYCYENFSSD